VVGITAEVATVPDDPATLLCIFVGLVLFGILFYIGTQRRP
jgi:hypothetical protein